jgi:hypothetical protein
MITARGRFEQSSGFTLYGEGFFLGGPCSSTIVSLYTDANGNYYYYEPSTGYVLTSGEYFYYDPWIDFGSGDWIWQSIYVAGPTLYYTGQYSSPCGPY